MYLPKSFRWYKDRYNRVDKHRVFRYPSPASEPLIEQVDENPVNYRHAYQGSHYDIRGYLAYNTWENLPDKQLYIDLTGMTAEEK